MRSQLLLASIYTLHGRGSKKTFIERLGVDNIFPPVAGVQPGFPFLVEYAEIWSEVNMGHFNTKSWCVLRPLKSSSSLKPVHALT